MALQNVKMVGQHRCKHARHIRQHAHLDGEVVKVVRAAKATQDVRQTLPARVIEVEAARGPPRHLRRLPLRRSSCGAQPPPPLDLHRAVARPLTVASWRVLLQEPLPGRRRLAARQEQAAWTQRTRCLMPHCPAARHLLLTPWLLQHFAAGRRQGRMQRLEGCTHSAACKADQKSRQQGEPSRRAADVILTVSITSVDARLWRY